MTDSKTYIQIVWGIMLVLMGILFLFRIPQIIPQLEQVKYFASMTIFIRFCLYLVAILLIGGGARKIYTYSSKPEDSEPDR